MNIFHEFNKIINSSAIQVATIHSKNINGTYTIITQNGQYADVMADGDYTGKVLIQHGRIIGDAPDLPYVEMDV